MAAKHNPTPTQHGGASLVEVARELGVTPQRVLQIERSAFAKCRRAFARLRLTWADMRMDDVPLRYQRNRRLR